jgi:hypothetical protein
VRFNLKDKNAWSEPAVKQALKAKSFSEMTVKVSPQ